MMVTRCSLCLAMPLHVFFAFFLSNMLVKTFPWHSCGGTHSVMTLGIVADDFSYVCLDKGKRKLVNVVDNSKHNAETSHTQRPKQ